MVRSAVLYSSTAQDPKYDGFESVDSPSGRVNYAKLSLDPYQYPQIATLILGYYQEPQLWQQHWPTYIRAHFNNPSCLQLLATGVRLALVQLPREDWLHPLSSRVMTLGYQNHPTGLMAYRVTKNIINLLREVATRGNRLRLDVRAPHLGIPYIFGMFTHNNHEYVVTEDVRGPNLYQVLERPGIYQDDLDGILLYLRNIFSHPWYFWFHTPLYLIYLRPIPIGCDYIAGPSDHPNAGLYYFRTRYVPICYYFGRTSSANVNTLREDLEFIASQYSYIFDQSYRPTYQTIAPRPATRIYNLVNTDLTSQSRWFQEAVQVKDPVDYNLRQLLGYPVPENNPS